MPFRLEYKPPGWFKTPAQARKHFDDELDRQLAESLRVRQLQPVGALADGTLLWGGRRLHAAIFGALPSLLTLVTDEPMTESEAKVITLTENLQREDLTSYEIWQATLELLQLNPGWNKSDLAAALKKSPSMVTRYLSPSETIPAVQEALKAGLIGIKAVYELSKGPLEAQPALLAQAIGGSTEVLSRQRRKQRAGNGMAAVRLDRFKIEQASGTCITLIGDGLDLEGIVESLATAAKDARKALADGLDAKTYVAVCRDRSRHG